MEDIRLPGTWKSWPAPAKRFVRDLLLRLRDGGAASQADATLASQLACLESLERSALELAALGRDAGRPAIAYRAESLLADIARIRDDLLDLGDL